jgi:WD repeat-containing protein 1 (actin-interacting protein 1)
MYIRNLVLSSRTYPMGTDLKDQQVGCLWQGNYILSVSLAGQITYLDRNSHEPLRVIRVKQFY